MTSKTYLHAKIHRATVTQTDLDYDGSITIDPLLLEAAGIEEYEQVHVVNVNNGQRLVTYAIAGKDGMGEICLNGAGARCACVGDKVIIMAYCVSVPMVNGGRTMEYESFRREKPIVVKITSQDNKEWSI